MESIIENNEEMSLKDFIQMMYENLEANMNQKFASVNQQFADLNAKMDGNNTNMNQRFAEVDERFVKAEANMESTNEHINLVEKTLSERITLVKDEVSLDIKTQIGEARSELQDVIMATNDRFKISTEKVSEQCKDEKSSSNITRFENDRHMANISKSLATVTAAVEKVIGESESDYDEHDDNMTDLDDLESFDIINESEDSFSFDTEFSENYSFFSVDIPNEIKASKANPIETKQLVSSKISSSNLADWFVGGTRFSMGKETMQFMHENANSFKSRGMNRAKKKVSKSKRKRKMEKRERQ